MARVTFVKKAQQRYETVPVIDPDTGKQKVVPVLKRDGTPKTTKTGREITRRLTMEDKTKPKPNRKCDKCGKEIEVGSPYKWIAPKSGPYGGSKRFRCGDCPTWQIWEYSGNKRAPIWQAQHEVPNEFESIEDAQSALNDFAAVVREVAASYGESADNIEDGFGHATYQSEELREQQESLERWAEELESVSFSVSDEPEGCEDHEEGNVVHSDEDDCDGCDEKRQEWMDELHSEVDDLVNQEP